MKGLGKTLIVVSALSFWGGAEVAKAAEELSCSTTSCSFNEEIGPSGTKTYHGHCDGTGNTEVTDKNSSMTCHVSSHMTCTSAFWGKYKGDFYWTCTCTNDSMVNESHPTIDITCPPPS